MEIAKESVTLADTELVDISQRFPADTIEQAIGFEARTFARFAGKVATVTCEKYAYVHLVGFAFEPAEPPANAVVITVTINNDPLLLSREFGTPVTRLSQTLSVREAVPEVRMVLELKPLSTVTVLDISAATSGGEPVYYQELYIPINPRRLYVDDTIRR